MRFIFCGKLYSLVWEVFQVGSQAHTSTLLHFHVHIKDEMTEGAFRERLSV